MESDNLDFEALVKRARRSRKIDESDVQAILATASDDEAELLYERLQQLNIRIVAENGETLEDPDESTGLMAIVDDDLDVEDDVSDLGSIIVEDDPVHTYLKEIGQVPLLTAEQEIWLATQMSAARVMDRLTRDASEDLGADDQDQLRTRTIATNYANLIENWSCAREASSIIGVEPPDLVAMIDEARLLRQDWRDSKGSYVRYYLNNGNWGQDGRGTHSGRDQSHGDCAREGTGNGCHHRQRRDRSRIRGQLRRHVGA